MNQEYKNAYELTMHQHKTFDVFDGPSQAGTVFYLDLNDGSIPRLYSGRKLVPNQTGSGGITIMGGRAVSVGGNNSRE